MLQDSGTGDPVCLLLWAWSFFLGEVDMEQEKDEERAPEIGMQLVGERFRKNTQGKWCEQIRICNPESGKKKYNRYPPEEPDDQPFYIAIFHSDDLFSFSSYIYNCLVFAIVLCKE
jgi:hypothetical protein